MAEIEEEATFNVPCEKFRFQTQTNGDRIDIDHIELDQGTATTLTWLFNHQAGTELEIQVKVKD